MVAFILPANSATGGYEISNSVRIGSGRKLSRTFTGVSAERKKHTISCWIKLCILDGENHMLYAVAGSNNAYIRINDDHMFRFRFFDSGDDQAMFQTNKLFRDIGAWYHIVFVYDSAQGTDTNRTKLYVNGEQITSFSSGTYSGGRFPDQNEESIIGNSAEHRIEGYSSGGEFYVADWYYIGNQALSPSDFGETNDNGVWVPKKFEGSFGSTNDTFLEFKQTGTSTDASGIGADTSGEGNHMASTNLAATDVTVDTPTNNFATLNPLISVQQVPTYSEGNTKVVFKDGGNGCSPLSTFAVNSGKFYFEAKFVQTSDPGHGAIGVGIVDADKYNPYGDSDDAFDLESFGYSYTTDGNAKTSGNDSSFGDEFNSGDIIGVAVDFDNRQIYYSKNGTFQDSGDPTSGASGTGSAHNFSAGTYYFAVYGYQNENSWEMNFGNAPFAISSGNADANGYGNFEYAVPSGYYSLCTKNLAEYG